MKSTIWIDFENLALYTRCASLTLVTLTATLGLLTVWESKITANDLDSVSCANSDVADASEGIILKL